MLHITVMLAFLLAMSSANAEEGVASVYGNENGQHRRADGKRYNPAEVLCAHRTRRFGSVVRVTVLATGRSIRCPIRDRGPYISSRVIDLSLGAAKLLGIHGLAKVRIDDYR